MKRKSSKVILAESFRELAQAMPIDRITVKDITEICGYSQATFYRQFRDKYDLIAWTYSEDLHTFMSPVEDGTNSWKQTLIEGARYYDSQRDYLRNLFLHTSGYDSFIFHMTDLNFQGLRRTVLKKTGRSELDTLTAMYIRLYCAGTVHISCEWILSRYPVTLEKLAEVYEHALPLPLSVVLEK